MHAIKQNYFHVFCGFVTIRSLFVQFSLAHSQAMLYVQPAPADLMTQKTMDPKNYRYYICKISPTVPLLFICPTLNSNENRSMVFEIIRFEGYRSTEIGIHTTNEAPSQLTLGKWIESINKQQTSELKSFIIVSPHYNRCFFCHFCFSSLDFDKLFETKTSWP